MDPNFSILTLFSPKSYTASMSAELVTPNVEIITTKRRFGIRHQSGAEVITPSAEDLRYSGRVRSGILDLRGNVIISSFRTPQNSPIRVVGNYGKEIPDVSYVDNATVSRGIPYLWDVRRTIRVVPPPSA